MSDVKFYEATQHVYPLNDVAEHVTDGSECWCGAEDDGEIVLHTDEAGRAVLQ